ncbi:MAG: hypothetical protein ACOX6E_01665 [Syntrophomonadaceae bacterium]|jgi:hypothetical protein
MKIYHVCEYCQLVYFTEEVEGPEGAIQLNGTCEDCTLELEHEMGTGDAFIIRQHYYN